MYIYFQNFNFQLYLKVFTLEDQPKPFFLHAINFKIFLLSRKITLTRYF